MGSVSTWARTLALLVVSSVAAAQQDPRQSLHRFELPNGLQIAVVENHAAPIVMVLVAVRAGANTQAPGERGMAHLFEHLLFRSYGYGRVAFGAATVDLEGASNGSTGPESVQYYLLLPAERALGGIELLGHLMRMESFTPREFDDERRIVLDELERLQTDPDRVLARRVARDLWGAAWHSRDMTGDSASLMAITTAQLRAAHARYYVPNNAVLVVTGDVGPEEVLEAARLHFGPWQRGPDPFAAGPPDSVAPLTGSRAVILPRAVPDVTIRIELQGPMVRRDTGATYAADALLEILNDSRSGFQERLLGNGLFQRIALSYTTMNGVGSIAIVGKTTPPAAQPALFALIQQLDSLEFLVSVTDDDLATARQRRAVEDALALEEATTLAPSLADWWASAGLDYYVSYRERLDALGRDDLRRFTQQYIVGQPKVIGVMGPRDAMTQLAEWLRGSVRQP